MPVYEALAHDLRSRGHTDVFGLMSDDTAMFVATLDAIGVRFHAARHENTAIGMAEGYAAASGRLGVAVIGRGPATANALHGALYAHRTGSRVLLIFGAAPQAAPAGPDSKAFNALGVFEAAGLRVRRATHFNTVLFPPIAAARLAKTLTGRRGGSDDSEPPEALNGLLRRLFAFETRLLRHVDLPFGVSILLIAERTEGSTPTR